MIDFVKNFWCHKVLPLVYTDALSYYEVLGKLIYKMNEVITNVNSLNENTVFTVNNIKPTRGNVNVGTVKSVNGSTPDESGNVNLPQVSGVTAVDGVGADSQGNVQLNAVKSVNGIKPVNGNVNVGTVKSVNRKTPDGDGNVNVGTVKSINTVNLPNDEGNIFLSAASVGAIANTDGSVIGSNLGQKSVSQEKLTDDLLYWPVQSLEISASQHWITRSWGRKYISTYGDGTTINLDANEYALLEDFWECYIINGGDATSLVLENMPGIIDLHDKAWRGSNANITITKYQLIHIKKNGTGTILIDY